MSEQTAEVPNQDEGQTQAKPDDVNQRLLRESQEYKNKLKEERAKNAELEHFRKLKLEEEGNFKSLLESEKARADRLESEAKDLRQKTLKGNIVSTISRFASDAVDLDDLLNQPKFKSIIEEGIDEDSLSLSEEKAQEYIKKVYEAKPHLRKQSTPITTHKGGKPGFVEKEAKEKTYSEMTPKERAELKIKLMMEKNNPN
jgi:hypothetical protein